MAARQIKITVVEEANGSRPLHLERESIVGVQDLKGNQHYHRVDGLTRGAIQDMINSLKLNPDDLKFEIEWKPSEGKSVLFNNLKQKKSKLALYIYWFIKDPDFSENVHIVDAKVNKPAISKGTAPNAIQHIEFTGKLKQKP